MEKSKYSWPGWETVRRIGSGGFGTVYEIQRDIYGDLEKAALKVITIPHSEDEVDYLRCTGLTDDNITQTLHKQVADIAREYKLMAQMRDNPNVVRCDDFRDIQHEDGLGWDIYIKMELLTPLMKCLDKVQMEEQILKLGMDMCSALAACQEKNIIHRDIKPQNIFISDKGQFKLGDFGIARTAERTTRATAGIGTYSYMAPEVEKNEAYGKTADIYSLGLVLYWLLNEKRSPFIPLPPTVPGYRDEEDARNRRFRGEQIPVPKNGSDALKAIVLKACAYDPKERYQSAKDMLLALEMVNAGTASATEPMPAAGLIPTEDAAVAEDLTVGPGWNNTAKEPAAEENMTVGPSWHDIPTTEDNDVTVGPVFAQKEATHTQTDPADKPKETQPKYKKPDVRWGRIGFAVVLIVVIVIACAIGLRGRHTPGWAESEGEKFYYDGNGEMLRACIANIGDNTYYFNAEGVMQTGWKKLNGDTYYFDQYGRAVKKCLADIGTNTYYFNAEGFMQTGWKKLNGSNYYFDNTGRAVKKCLAKIDGNTYYFNAEGIMQRGWKQLNGNEYYFDFNGVMATGSRIIDGQEYVFDEVGRLLLEN